MDAASWLFSWYLWSHKWHFGDLETHWWQRPFSGTFVTCWLKVYGLEWQFLLFQVGFTSFSSFGKKSLCICLGRQMFIRSQVQGQVNSTAVVRKLGTVVLVLTHSRRSDLIGSRLDLHMDLETPKVREFTSGVLGIGWKRWKNRREGPAQQLGEDKIKKDTT